jgi:hypothetical protein
VLQTELRERTEEHQHQEGPRPAGLRDSSALEPPAEHVDPPGTPPHTHSPGTPPHRD